MNGNAVRVVLWGETVGYLTWDSSNWRTTTAVFSFAKDFLDKGLDISPIWSSHVKASEEQAPKNALVACIRSLLTLFLTIGETAFFESGQKVIRSV